jgi:glycosyltransferase involved in cell wall biosynthesis
MDTRVSVLLTTYNEPDTITPTIEGVLNQTFKDFELVVVDDSTDKTREILEEYAKKDMRIKLILNAERLGFMASLKKGIDNCSGEYIARLDAGDICDPTRLEKQSGFLDTNPSVYIVGCFHRWVDKEGKVLSTYAFPTDPKRIRSHIFGFGAIAAHPCIMIRKSLFEKAGGYDASSISLEYDLYMKTLAAGLSIANIPEYLLDVLRRGEGMSLSRNREIVIDMFRIRLKYLPRMFSIKNTVYTFMSFMLILVPTRLVRSIICSPLWSKNLRNIFLKG